MFSTARRTPLSIRSLALLFLAAAALEGCNSNRSEQQVVEQWFKDNPNLKRIPVAPLSGHVSVDGQPPAKGTKLFVVLSDADHIQPPGKEGPDLFTHCDAEGNFSFKTYVAGDGVPCKKYVVSFLGLHSATKRNGQGGFGGVSPNRQKQFAGPDDLKNLYSDPKKNLSDPKFVIDVKEPGRTDYEFNLEVAGKDPIVSPSEYVPSHLAD